MSVKGLFSNLLALMSFIACTVHMSSKDRVVCFVFCLSMNIELPASKDLASVLLPMKHIYPYISAADHCAKELLIHLGNVIA